MDLHDIAGASAARSIGPRADAAAMAGRDGTPDRLGGGGHAAIPHSSA